MIRKLVALWALLLLVVPSLRAETIDLDPIPGKPTHPAVIFAQANQYVEFDLRRVTQVKEGEYSLTSGPRWVRVTADGILVGKPSDKDVGEHEVKVAVQITDDKGLLFAVKIVVGPDQNNLVVKAEAKVGEAFRLDLRRKTGLEGRWRIRRCPAWVKLDLPHFLVGTPAAGDAGVHRCLLTVATPKGVTAEVAVAIDVKKASEQPVVPVLAVPAGKQLTVSLKRLFNLDGTFTLMSKQPWISVSEEGLLLAAPTEKDIGDHRVQVKVADGAKVVLARLVITVMR